MIVIYGATGLTGSLLAEELVARGQPVVLSGRDRGRLERLANRLGGLEFRQAEVHDARRMAAALAGARVVVACAGPFLKVGEPVLRAAIEAGAHYLDITGEQAFMRDMYERYDSRARRAKLAAVSGFAFEIALGDWAAARAAQLLRAEEAADVGGRKARLALARARLDEPAGEDPVDEVVVGYAISQLRPSTGTQASAIESLRRPGCVWHEDRWERAAPASRARSFQFPPPWGERTAISFPSGEVVSVPRHVAARRVETYLAYGDGSPLTRGAARLVGLVGPLLPALAASPLGALARAHAGGSRQPAPEERALARFAVVAEASRRFRRARVSLSGTDLYRVAAAIAAAGAEKLAGADPPALGVLAPSQIADPVESLAELVGEGLIALEEC
jgi:short subunit dehydrogenase-like uncharacterized protein